MAARTSLRQAVELLADQFVRGNHGRLAIVHNPRGKYYSTLTMDELAASTDQKIRDGNQLIMVVTKRELMEITRTPQADLFRKAEPDAN